jgi:aminoglycoside 3-N-acetyltransferase
MNTRRTLERDLVSLGLRRGDLAMVHAGLRSVGPVVGGVNVLIQALLDVVGPDGTLTAYVDFEPFYDEDDPPEDAPAFDKRIAHAARDHGILHETMRNWPGALRSDHPDAGVVAIGRLAEWITERHPFQYGYGPGTPFERIVEAGGRVLMIGAPLDTVTILHHAEHIARIPGKRIVRYRRRMPGGVWTDFEEFDTGDPVADYLPIDCFQQIGEAYLASGRGASGTVGAARSHLLDAPDLVRFAVEWLEAFPHP